jgi:hypothetical protein
MTFTKKDLTLLIPLLVFLLLGFYWAYSVDFLQYDKVFSISIKWFVAPTIIVSTYYAYYSTFGYDKNSALWRKLLGLLALTLIFSLMILRAFQGYLTYYNCNFGTQTKLTVKGIITRLDFPKTKKPLNTYSVELLTDNTHELIKLEVPTKNYSVGQFFEKEMIVGSLGILYYPKLAK